MSHNDCPHDHIHEATEPQDISVHPWWLIILARVSAAVPAGALVFHTVVHPILHLGIPCP